VPQASSSLPVCRSRPSPAATARMPGPWRQRKPRHFSRSSSGVRQLRSRGSWTAPSKQSTRAPSLRAASRAAQSRLADLRTLIELEVRQAWLDIREARARVASAADAVAEADENLRISRELYGTGLGTNTQVLDAVALQITATNNRDNAALDETLALYRLSYASGRL
jgi:outer membrane protein TolC